MIVSVPAPFASTATSYVTPPTSTCTVALVPSCGGLDNCTSKLTLLASSLISLVVILTVVSSIVSVTFDVVLCPVITFSKFPPVTPVTVAV